MANDDADIMRFMKTASLKDILSNVSLWDEDLSYLESEIIKYVNQ